MDIEKISWDKSVRNYSFVGDYDYEGLEVGQELLEDDPDLGSVLDTLKELYEPFEDNLAFSSNIASRYYAVFNYHYNSNWNFGAVFHGEDYRETFNTAVTVFANRSIGPLLQVGASYGIRNETYDNLGLNGVLRLGPVQVFAATDNIISLVQPTKSELFNARIGMNIVFGGPRETVPINEIENQESFFNR